MVLASGVDQVLLLDTVEDHRGSRGRLDLAEVRHGVATIRRISRSAPWLMS